jgi:hypothetical protein
MRVPKLRATGKAAVILGAGATRGAHYVPHLATAVPPLDTDFFNQLQMLVDPQHKGVVRELISAARDEFGPDLRVTMEGFFTHVEFLDEFHTKLGVARGRKLRAYSKIQSTFRRALGALLEATTEQFGCAYHEQLVNMLQPGDAILTFNYDTTIDRALRERGGNRWDPTQGYAVPVVSGADEWGSAKTPGQPPKQPIRLLKLHGSLHWQRGPDGGGIKLTTPPYDADQFLIVPPAWNKPIADDPTFSRIWKEARLALRSASMLVVVGYSVPATDMLARALLQVEATVPKSQHLKHLVIANPEPTARGDMIRLLGGAISDQTRVVWVNYFHELHQLLIP